MTSKTVSLYKELIRRGYVSSRSQAEDFVMRKLVKVNSRLIVRPDSMISTEDKIDVLYSVNFVSRAGEKLYFAIKPLNLDFKDKVVLDVGSSTGGFTEVSLYKGAKNVIAVEKGTNQMHPKLRQNPRVNLYEKTDITNLHKLTHIDLVLIDVSFTSLRTILPHITQIIDQSTTIIALVKPQFESSSELQHKGIFKNERIRRDTLKKFEQWANKRFVIEAKVDSKVNGAKGNTERFYRLKTLN